MEFFSAFAASVVSAGTSLCACNCFYCRTSGTEKTGLSGNSSAVGRKSHKGKLFLLFVGKEDCHIYYARNFLYCGLPFFWLGCWFGSRKEAFLAFWTGRKWDFCCVDFLFSGIWLLWSRSGWKSEMPWEQEEYAGTIFLAICIFLLFIGWQNFYVENSLTRHWQKWEKTIPCLSMFFTTRFCRPCPDALKAEGACLQWDTAVWDDVCVCCHCGDGGVMDCEENIEENSTVKVECLLSLFEKTFLQVRQLKIL